MSHGHLVWQNVAKCKICSAVTLINGSIGCCCHGQEATVRGCAHVPPHTPAPAVLCLSGWCREQTAGPHPHIVHANLACVLNFLPRPRAVIIVTPVGGGWWSGLSVGSGHDNALWANHLKGWCIFWNWSLSGLQGVEVCEGCCWVCPWVMQNVCRDTECVQGAVLTSSLAQQD